MMNILNSYLCSLSLLFTETGLIVPSGDTIGTSLRLLFLFQLPNMNGSLWVLFPISKVSECWGIVSIECTTLTPPSLLPPPQQLAHDSILSEFIFRRSIGSIARLCPYYAFTLMLNVIPEYVEIICKISKHELETII